MNTYEGFFITLEGGEGAGKSTIAKKLLKDLQNINPNVILTREPGTGKLGEKIRNIILDDENIVITEKVEALLFAADRAQHVEDLIKPVLLQGGIVICDRYMDSSIAYQGYGRNLSPEEIEQLSTWATNSLTPDLTFFIDVKPETGLARKTVQQESNKMETMEIEFHNKVYEGFKTIAAANPKRIKTVNGEQNPEEVYENILQEITYAITAKNFNC